jgi:hypothetical protein
VNYPFSTTVACLCRIIRFGANLIFGRQDKVTYLVYRWLLTSFEYGNYQSKWLSEIKRILDSTGFTHVWANHTEADLSPAWIGEAIKQRLKDQFIQKWMADLDMSSKCINYRAFKVAFSFEDYLVELPQRLSVPLM